MQAKLIALVLAVLGVAGAYAYGRHDGRALERAAWEARESAALREANLALDAAHKTAREKELRITEAFVEASTNYQARIKELNDEKDRDIADLRSGARRLRIVVASCEQARERLPDTPAATGRRDGGATAELPGETAATLLAIGAEADAIVHQLTACQAALRAR